MQTKTEIQQLLAIGGLRPNKKLGQHFLVDLNLMRLFVNRPNITKDDIVLEVGPGTGSMTSQLIEITGHVIAVEYDRALVQILKKVFAGKDSITIIDGDILKNQNALNEQLLETVHSLRQNFSGRFLLVSNLPYDISSSLIINLIIGSLTADEMYVTVQKEIAEKMIATSGDDLYGTLSIFIAAAGRAEIFHKLGKTVFWPEPQVDSAMVQFIRDPAKVAEIKDMRIFKEVVSLFFQHRRKMLKACTKFATGHLESITDWIGIFEKLNIEITKRPDELPASDFVRIANLCTEK